MAKRVCCSPATLACLGCLMGSYFFLYIIFLFVAMFCLSCVRSGCKEHYDLFTNKKTIGKGVNQRGVFRFVAVAAGVCEIPLSILSVVALLLDTLLLLHAVFVLAARCCWARMRFVDLPPVGIILLQMLWGVMYLGVGALTVMGLIGLHACQFRTCHAGLGPSRSEKMVYLGFALSLVMLFFYVPFAPQVFKYDRVFRELSFVYTPQRVVYPVDDQGNLVRRAQVQLAGQGNLPV